MSTHTSLKQYAARLTRAATLAVIVVLGTLAGCEKDAPATPPAGANSNTSAAATPNTNAADQLAPTAGSSAAAPADQFGPTTPPPSSPPTIKFEALTHDFGVMAETDVVTTTFKFTNTGGSTLKIAEVKPTCSCTSASLNKWIYEPGESGEIHVRFAPTTAGRQAKLIHVASNDAANPRMTISIQATVEAFITMEPEHIKFGTILPGHSETRYVSIFSPDAEMRVRNVSATDPNVAVRIVQASSEESTAPVVGQPGQALIEVTVSDKAPWGPLFSWVSVQVEGTPPGKQQRTTHTRQFRVEASIFGDLVAEPDTFRAGARPGEPFTRTLRLKRISGEPFTIHKAIVTNIQTTATLARATLQLNRLSPSEYELVLNAACGQTIGPFTAVVDIETDVPGEEQIQIGIAGRVIGPAG